MKNLSGTALMSLALFAALAILPAAVPAAGPLPITELPPLDNSSSSSGMLVNSSGMIAGNSYSQAVVWPSMGSVLPVGTFGGNYSWVEDMNDAGQVVGGAQTSDPMPRAFIWTEKTGLRDLGTPAGEDSIAYGINSHGQVAGHFGMNWLTTGSQGHGFFWSPQGGMIDIGTLGGPNSSAYDINDAGQMVGDSQVAGDVNPTYHAFIWTLAEGMQDLGVLHERGSWATGINNEGEIRGGGYTPQEEIHAFFWDKDGVIHDMGTLGGAYTVSTAMNDMGQVVGTSNNGQGESRAFLWSMATGMIDLGLLGGNYSIAQGINEEGHVVGWSNIDPVNGALKHAFLWTPEDGMIDLGTLGGLRSASYDISESGQIVGSSSSEAESYYPQSAVYWGEAGSGGSGDCAELDDILTEIEALAAAGVLNTGRANALSTKIVQAGKKLIDGKAKTASNVIGAFINQVEAFMNAGILTEAEGYYLIDLAEGALFCTG